jgi:GTP:adenosylcobinamide-phosphate guanylyltransferase
MFTSVVLAGERPAGGVLSQALGLPASVLVDVAGKPSLQRVLEAITAATQAEAGLVCGPAAEVYHGTPALRQMVEGCGFQWLAPAQGPSASAIRAVEALRRFPVLITTGDHALLTPELIDGFCRKAQVASGDVVVGLVPHSLVQAAFPESHRTVQRYRDGAFCGSNLFAILDARGLHALRFWQAVEAERKRPWKIAQKLGPVFLFGYLARQVSLAGAMKRLSDLCGCRITCVEIDSARAAVDVDTLADRDLAERIIRSENTN